MSVFDEVLKVREEQKKKEELAKSTTGNFQNYDFEEVSYTSLQSKENIPFRPVGNPPEFRKDKTDAKYLLQSQIVKDDGTGYIKVNWPFVFDDKSANYVPDPKWILTRLHDKVKNTGGWEPLTESDVDGVNIIKYDDGSIKNKRGYENKFVSSYCNTPSFARITSNIKDKDKYSKTFYPSIRVIMPVIGKTEEDYNWCKENKHCQVLTSKKTQYSFKNEKGEEVTVHYIDTGVPKTVYDLILEKVVRFRNTWDLDVLAYKSGTAQNAYDVKDALSNPLPPEWEGKLNADELTEEEKSWERYDLDKLFPTSSKYSKLYKHLIGLFKQVDIDTGSKFSEELERLVEQEKLENEKQKGETPENKAESNTEVVKEKVQEKPKREGRESAVKTEEPTKSVGTDCFPHWEDLSDADKDDILESIISVDEHELTFEFKNGVALIPCDNSECGIMLPNSVLVCPKCGLVFK